MRDELSTAEARLRDLSTQNKNACVVMLSTVMGMVRSVGRSTKEFHSEVGECVKPRNFENRG